jgi:hypothetical protein
MANKPFLPRAKMGRRDGHSNGCAGDMAAAPAAWRLRRRHGGRAGGMAAVPADRVGAGDRAAAKSSRICNR